MPIETIILNHLGITRRKELRKLLAIYQETLFNGKLGRANIESYQPLLKPDTVPQSSHPYTIPESIRELTKRELDRLMQEDIIYKASNIA